MPRQQKGARKVPALVHHRPSGQARVRIDGKDHYCGVWGSIEAQKRYVELIEQWQRAGHRLPGGPVTVVEAGFSVRMLCQTYLDYLDATGRYLKDGKPTSQRGMIRRALDEFVESVGDIKVAKLNEGVVIRHRDRLEANPKLTRKGINRKIGLLMMLFRWGKSRGYVSKLVWSDLRDVEPLAKHECGGRFQGYKKRIPTLADVLAVAQVASRQIGTMLRVQLLGGLRPGEVCAMRWEDLTEKEHDGCVYWEYVVENGKTAHHERETRYLFDEAVMEMLRPFRRPGGGALFRPCDAMLERGVQLRADRKTPITKQTRERDAGEKRAFGEVYSNVSYRQAVERACVAAEVERFTPHAIRHLFASWVANHAGFGPGAATVALNHASRSTTDRYVHPDDTLRFKVARLAAKEMVG